MTFTETCEIDSPGCVDCKIVSGWNCSSTTSCVEICQDGLVVGQEACIAGNEKGCLEDCSDVAPYYSCIKGDGSKPSKCNLITAQIQNEAVVSQGKDISTAISSFSNSLLILTSIT